MEHLKQNTKVWLLELALEVHDLSSKIFTEEIQASKLEEINK